MGDELSDEAVVRATGRSRRDWHRVLDSYGLDLDHTRRTRRLADEHPEVPGWWCQSLVVDFERARGLRVKGQASTGDFQVSCSKTLQGSAKAAWQRLMTTPFLPAPDGRAAWREGATWDAVGGRVEVRKAEPGKMLRWFWHDMHGKSTVEVALEDKGNRCTIVFAHKGLPTKAAAEAFRARWKAAIETIAG